MCSYRVIGTCVHCWVIISLVFRFFHFNQICCLIDFLLYSTDVNNNTCIIIMYNIMYSPY